MSKSERLHLQAFGLLNYIMDAPLLQAALRSPELLSSILVLLAAYTIRFLLPTRTKKLDNSPVLGAPGDADFHAALDEGYNKVGCFKALKTCDLSTDRVRVRSIKTRPSPSQQLIIRWLLYLRGSWMRSKHYLKTSSAFKSKCLSVFWVDTQVLALTTPWCIRSRLEVPCH